MILELYISEETARKIQGLSVLSGKSPIEITKSIENNLGSILNQQILESIGLDPTTFAKHSPAPATTNTTLYGSGDPVPDTTRTMYTPETKLKELYPDEEDDMGTTAKDINDLLSPDKEESTVGELSSMKMEDLDPEIIFPKEGYDDPFMKAVQDEIDLNKAPSRANVSEVRSDEIGDDTPRSDMGESVAPDRLPIDFGIGNISENDHGAADFFMKVMNGQQGNKQNRNNKRVIR